MRILSICIFSLLVVSNPGYAIELGDPLPEGSSRTGKSLMITSSQFSDTYAVEENGTQYQVTLDRKNIINFISLSSKSFTTPEGIHVGSTYNDVWSVTMESMRGEPGWGHYIRLPSGWMAAFCVGGSCSGYPNLDDKVDWLFKRR